MSPVGSLGFLLARSAHRAGDAQSGLLIQLLELGQQGFVLHHQLGDAVKIAQHGKGQTGADLAHVIEKPGQLHALARRVPMRSSPQVWLR